MERFSAEKLIVCALFAALACVATMSIRIPTPGAGGYIRPGGVVVTFCGILMGPAEAFLAADIGSSMVDLLGGYFIYAPITFVIRGLVAYLSSRLCRGLSSRGRGSYLVVAGYGVIGMAMVAGGYFLCEIFLCGTGTALVSVPSNLTQGIGGLIITCALYPVLRRPLEVAMTT